MQQRVFGAHASAPPSARPRAGGMAIPVGLHLICILPFAIHPHAAILIVHLLRGRNQPIKHVSK